MEVGEKSVLIYMSLAKEKYRSIIRSASHTRKSEALDRSHLFSSVISRPDQSSQVFIFKKLRL